MMPDAIVRYEQQPLAGMEDLVEEAEDYARRSKAANTKAAYSRDWDSFRTWCELHGRPLMPADGETVALYLTDLARRCKVATIQRHASTISQAHKLNGYP